VFEERVNIIQLRDYPDTPLYNIKAVVQATGITSSTLRAWERRYQVTQPQRSESGYRLYSDRDIMLIRWLKSHVDAGMAISQVVAWLDQLRNGAADPDDLQLPATQETLSEQLSASSRQLIVRDYASLQQDLLQALLHLREAEAETILAEAFSFYPLELVGDQVITPVLIEIGERWHRGEINVTHEHFATTYLQQRLAVFLRTVPTTTGGPLIWIACPPKEEHEIGALMLTLYLRRAGYRVQYLGKNLPIDDLIADVQRYHPALLLLSAATEEAANQLTELTALLSALPSKTLTIGYGGRAFQEHPTLRNQIQALYLGDTALEAVDKIHQLLSSNPRPTVASDGNGKVEKFKSKEER